MSRGSLKAEYIRFVLDTIRSSKARGLSVDEAATMELPAPYYAWEASMVHEWNIRSLWDQE